VKARESESLKFNIILTSYFVPEFVLLEESPEKTNALTSFFVAKFRMDMWNCDLSQNCRLL